MESDLEKQAKEAFIDDHFELAVELFTQAIDLNPNNAELFAERAQANIKLNNFTEAVADANKAIELDPSLSKAYFRKGTACMKLEEYQTAKAALETGASLALENQRFTNLIKERDQCIAEETGVIANQSSEITILDTPTNDASTDVVQPVNELANQVTVAAAKPKPKYRHEFYQRPEELVVTIFAKGIPANNVSVDFGEQILSVTIDVPGEDAYHFQPCLFGKIVPSNCRYDVLSTKVEIRLAKAEPIYWRSPRRFPRRVNAPVIGAPRFTYQSSKPNRVDWHKLEDEAMKEGARVGFFDNFWSPKTYIPTSKPNRIDWHKLEAEAKEEEKDKKLDGDATLEKLFRDIYADADEYTKKPKRKFFVESNRTLLSTDWKEVGSKKVEGSPPDGMEMKKWEYNEILTLESLIREDWTGPLERRFAEEGSKEKLTLEPQAVVIDVEAEGIQESLTDEDWTGPLERLFAEEGSKEKLTLEPQAVVFDVEAGKMSSNSSEQTKFEIEEIGNEASQTRQPEGILVVEMQTQAISTLKPQRVVFANPAKDEDWENAKEIYLMDNELSVLPENPRCPELSALFIQRNYRLRTIPPSFFDHMPALQILNLSRTGIKSLPDSVISLVSLKRLFLNECHRFMMLSPNVGELKQLEVLDLDKTQIMDLPKEIKKLTNLTCLEVSFCGTYVQSNVVVIPCGVISALSQLEELNIDVDPDDEWWDACVEAIVNEVCTLKRLETLKFYFPRLELLRKIQMNIPSLFNFRFIVGRHVKRIMSRVPPDVEIELERWERCLKYINGVGVPREIQKVLQHATAFFLDRHASIKKISDFGNKNMEELKCLVIGECNEVQVIIDQEDDSNEVASEKIVLGSLEYMYVYYMKSLWSIWEGSVQRNSLCLLKSLTLVTCPQLTTIFTQGLLANLCNLEELKVEDCPSINNLVSFEISAEHKASDFLPNLKKISLHYMPGLVSISGGLHIAPKLEWLSFYNCPNLKNPLIDEVSTQDLKKIKGERSWWEALEWSNGCPGYLDEIFVQIDILDC